MKIKEPSARNRRITALKQKYVHWWLAPEKPRGTSRLGQLNKFNNRIRVPSEFILMAQRIEDRPYNVFNQR